MNIIVGCVLSLPLVHLLLTSHWSCVGTLSAGWIEAMQCTRQPGPTASHTHTRARISRTANKPVKWQPSSVQQVSKINPPYFPTELTALWLSLLWRKKKPQNIPNVSGMAKHDGEWLWRGIAIIWSCSVFFFFRVDCCANLWTEAQVWGEKTKRRDEKYNQYREKREGTQGIRMKV